jgi:flap endonuclease-1
MGVDLSGIVEGQRVELKDFKEKVLAIDGHNTLYQFLATIRQGDGTLLTDSSGRITSHLSGIFYRVTKFLEMGIKPVFVFDGIPYPQKMRTIEARIAVREKAMDEWKKALEVGDLETAKSKAQQTSHLTKEMIQQAKKLLALLGVPCIDAPRDGEAQASFLVENGDADYSVSQDYDSLLFGTPRLVRNLAISGKRKLPKKKEYVEITPELIELEKFLTKYEITREQLVDIGILVGTDFNEGVSGIGAKKALRLIKEYGSLEEVIRAKGIEVPAYADARKIFLEPEVNRNYQLEWHAPDVEGIVSMLCNEFEFSEERVRKSLEFVKVMRENKTQKSLDDFF